MIGFLIEREYQQAKKNTLFFGCYHHDMDFIYREQLEDLYVLRTLSYFISKLFIKDSELTLFMHKFQYKIGELTTNRRASLIQFN
jgi:sulfite reductase alpha subunit-like flavoprotein